MKKAALTLFAAALIIIGCSSSGGQTHATDSKEIVETEATKARKEAQKKAEEAKARQEAQQKALANAEPKEVSADMQAIMTTTKGEIVLNLAFEDTPVTVANFVGLAEGDIPNDITEEGTPYYDGLTFHRVIPDFMIQGGDPEGTGRGGPGYKFQDEFVPGLKHHRPGTFSMANSGPATNGSQFFITHKDTPWLDNKHTVFGYVVEGQDVVDAIGMGDKIVSVKIKRNSRPAKKFDAAKIFKEQAVLR